MEHPDRTVPGMGLGYVTTLFESWPAESLRRHAFGRPDRFRRKDLDFEWGEFPDSNQKNQNAFHLAGAEADPERLRQIVHDIIRICQLWKIYMVFEIYTVICIYISIVCNYRMFIQ